MPSQAIVARRQSWVCALAVLAGCKSPPEAKPTVATVDAAVIGCADVEPGGACVFEPGHTLSVWAAVDRDAKAHLYANGNRLDASATAVEGGLRWTVEAQESWRSMSIEATSSRVQFTLTQRGPPTPELAPIRSLRDADKLDEARDVLTRILPTLPERPRIEAHELDGDLAFLRGDIKAAIEAYGAGAQLAAKRSRYRKASSMAQRIAYACTALEPDESCAQRWLEKDAGWIDGDREQQVLHDYYRALFDNRVGERRVALQGFSSTITAAHATGLQAVEVGALTEAMLLVAAVGDWTAARAYQTRAEALSETLREAMQAQLQNAIGWMLLLARARGQTDLPSPTPAFERALALTTGDDALSKRMRATLRLNLAYDSLLEDDLERVQQRLADVDPSALLHEDERMWAALLHARVDARLGHLEAAREAFAKLATEATAARESELAWHAHVGTAEVLAQQGRTTEAVASHEEAATILRRQLPRIALGAGRAHYLAERSRGTRAHIELLLASGRIEDALCVTRRARTRNLRVLAQSIHAGDAATQALRSYREGRTRLERDLENAWLLPAAQAEARFAQLRAERLELHRTLDREVFAASSASSRSCEAFPSPQHDEVSVHYVELRDEWVGFSVDETRTMMRRLGPRPESSTPAALGEWLLNPFEAVLSEAEHVRIVASGALHEIQFAQLSDPSDPSRELGQRLSVAYGLDVPRPRSPPKLPPKHRVLVVAPPSNLDAAEAERNAVVTAAHNGPADVQLLSGNEATGDAVRRALPNVDLVHFVGHAASEDDGWTGRLQLARDDVLQVQDVLALQQVPQTLVLAGCETGRVDVVALAGGMSLAHAFLLAGADTVVAAGRKISDRATAALAQPFYSALRDKRTVPQALAIAQASVHAKGLERPALRVWVR